MREVPVHTFAKLPVHALINDLKIRPKQVNCIKMTTFGGVTYFLKVGQGPDMHISTFSNILCML